MATNINETSKNELVELALAGLDAQIRELNEKKEELKKLLVAGPVVASKRVPKADTTVKAGRGAKAGKKGGAAKTEKIAKSSRSVAAEGSEEGSGKKKRVFSAATRKKLREAAKARWAREKEAKPAE